VVAAPPPAARSASVGVAVVPVASNGEPFAGYLDFQIPLLGDMVDLSEDFTRWMRQSGFSFIDHACVLDTSFKSKARRAVLMCADRAFTRCCTSSHSSINDTNTSKHFVHSPTGSK
jgi:hypothetical protein